MTQELVLEVVKNMPVEFEINELIERLDFMEKVTKGLQQIKEGKIIPHQEVVNMIKTWQK